MGWAVDGNGNGDFGRIVKKCQIQNVGKIECMMSRCPKGRYDLLYSSDRMFRHRVYPVR